MNEQKQQHFGIHFGVMCESFASQIRKQHFKYDSKKVKEFQKYHKALLTLRFADLLTDIMYEKIRSRLYRQMVRHIVQKNKLK